MAEDSTPLIRLDTVDGVATVTLDSPHNRNALSRRLVAELRTALHECDKDDAVTVVVLQATGRVFCSGADLTEASTVPMEESTRGIVALQRQIVALGKPVVTRLHGPVRAGGVGLVAASDIVVAGESADVALTEVRLGLAPAAISLTILPRIDPRKASYAMLTGSRFGAAEAAEMGLVTLAVADDELDGEIARVVGELSRGAAQGLRETKRLLVRDLVAHIDAHGEDVAHLSARLFGSEAARSAMRAFLDKT